MPGHRALPLVLLAIFASASQVRADTFEIVRRWSGFEEHFELEGRLLPMPDGSFYGTTRLGGEFGHGSIFHVTPDGGGYAWTEVYAFHGLDGRELRGSLERGSDGFVYGTTLAGGATDAGTVFRLDAAGRLTRLHDFAAGGGRKPSPVRFLPDGSLLGTTAEGGLNDQGTVFRLDPSGVLTVLHDFGGPADGKAPTEGCILGPDGRYWGATPSGGESQFGTLFRIDASGNYEKMHDFTGQEFSPSGELATEGAYVWGTTTTDAVFHVFGHVYRIDMAGVFTTLHTFDTSTGGRVMDGLTRGPGYFFGLTHSYSDPEPPPGGATSAFYIGVTFVVDFAGGFGIVGPLSPADPNFPAGGLAWAPDNNLYAIGYLDTSLRVHGILRLQPSGVFGPTAIKPDAPELWRRAPYTGLMEASDGNLYATVNAAHIRVDQSGSESTFRLFADNPLRIPALTEASDHNFYSVEQPFLGTGQLVRVDPSSGNATPLHEFDFAVEGCCAHRFVQASDGLLYGGNGGGPSFQGTVFRTDLDGNVEVVHALAGADGESIGGELLEASDGDFYGVTRSGGAFNGGTLFRVAPDGDFEVLHDFSDAEGNKSEGTLIQASDGDLYGTTTEGGANLSGTIFRSDRDGDVVKLYDAGEYSRPSTRLVERGGFLYGTLEGTSQPAEGRIFRMDFDGNVSVLRSFPGEICSPYNFFEGVNGDIYFTTESFGTSPVDAGILYRLAAEDLPAELGTVEPSSGRALGGAALRVSGRHFREGDSLAFGGTPAAGAVVDRESLLIAVAPPLAPGTLYEIALEPAELEAATATTVWFADFLDVEGNHPFHDFVETIFRMGITAGCGGGAYCPDDPVTRAQMAVFLLKSEHGSAYIPPACAGAFADVACPSPFADWIEQLAAEGVTAGCGTGIYCPDSPVTRAQMAPFLLKAVNGSGYVPPPCTGLFADVTCPSLFADWIEALSAAAITVGCGNGNYCPDSPNTRGQMAVFLTKAFELAP